MQIKTPCCKLYLQQGAEKQIEQLSVSFIRTIPSAPESHRISGCINSRSRACGNAIYRRWGIAPRPETDFLALSIAQVLQIARGCAIIDKNKFGDWVVFPCCLVHSGGLGQHRTIPALRLKHRSGSCGTASAAPRSPYRHLELCGIALENFQLYCQMPGFDWAFIFWLTFAGGQTKSSRMGVKMSSRTPGSRASQPWIMPSVFSIVSPAVTSRTSPPMVKRKRPDTT